MQTIVQAYSGGPSKTVPMAKQHSTNSTANRNQIDHTLVSYRWRGCVDPTRPRTFDYVLVLMRF